MSYYAVQSSSSLSHHGMKGQKHGVRNAEWYPIDAYRAHLANSGYSKEAINKITSKVDQGKSNFSIKRTIKKETKKRDAELAAKKKATNERLQKMRDAKAAKEKAAKEKADIINRGDLASLKKRQNEFTNEEIRATLDRYNAFTQLSDIERSSKLRESELKAKELSNKMGTIQDVTNKVANATTNGINVWNNVAKVANAFGDAKLPIIGQQQNQQTTNIQYNNVNGTVSKTVKDGKGNSVTTIDNQKKK